jgi:hypothetical protein
VPSNWPWSTHTSVASVTLPMSLPLLQEGELLEQVLCRRCMAAGWAGQSQQEQPSWRLTSSRKPEGGQGAGKARRSSGRRSARAVARAARLARI